jgi:Ca2+-binding RTX toxin-like protein
MALRRSRAEALFGRFIAVGVVATMMALAAPAGALAFGTVSFLGQDREHERMTRAALACPAAQKSDGSCFEPRSVAMLAGELGLFGAVGAPDFPPPEKAAAHCDEADYIDAARDPRAKKYAQTRAQARKRLVACHKHLRAQFNAGVAAAGAIVNDQGVIVPTQVDLTTNCRVHDRKQIPTWLRAVLPDDFAPYLDSILAVEGGVETRAKCLAILGFGKALHGVEDFYSHTNWVDAKVARQKIRIENPAGLQRADLPPLLNLRALGSGKIRFELISGCFSLNEKLSPLPDGCKGRAKHIHLQKDEGTIDSASGAATNPGTPRGQVPHPTAGTNFAAAVGGAIRDVRTRQWPDFRDELAIKYGPRKANLITCALTHDDPVNDCQGRKVAIVIDTSGSNTTADPNDLRFVAAILFNDRLVSQEEAGPSGRPDRSTIIDFDNSASVISPLGDPELASFAGLDSSGGTNIAAGINTAINELTKDPADPTAGRSGLVVFTDGQDSDRPAEIAAINRARDLGIRVSYGFLSAPPNALPAAPVEAPAAAVSRAPAGASSAAPPADLVAAILETGGFFSTIDSAESQQAFVDLVTDRGATGIDDPNGSDDGGPLTNGPSVTALASGAGDRDSFSYEATRGRYMRIGVTALQGQQLVATIDDVRRGSRLIQRTSNDAGEISLIGRLRKQTLLELQVRAKNGSGSYTIQLTEEGVDLIGTRKRNQLRCQPVPTYVIAKAGNDRVTCARGNDMIIGGRGTDLLRGGNGDDIFLIGKLDLRRGIERIQGQKGNDTVNFLFKKPRRALCRGNRALVPGPRGGTYFVTGTETISFQGKRC